LPLPTACVSALTESLLQILEAHSLQVSASKSILFSTQMEFLGHLITPNGIIPTEDKRTHLFKAVAQYTLGSGNGLTMWLIWSLWDISWHNS